MKKPNTRTVVLLILLCLLPIVVAMAAPALASVLTPSRFAVFVGVVGGCGFVCLLLIIEGYTQFETSTTGLPTSLDSLIARSTKRMSNAMMLCDPSGKTIWVNDAFTTITGYSFGDTIGTRPGELLQGKDTDPETVALLSKHIADGVPYTCDIMNYRKDGTSLWVRLEIIQILNEQGGIEAIVGSQFDITEQKQYELDRDRQLEEALAAADLDPLTGLLNHRAYHNHLRMRAKTANNDGSRLAMLMLDLDNFRFFNEAYGHLVGDQVLKQVAETLRSASIGFGFENIARFGGDEFAVLVPGYGTSVPEIHPEEIEHLFNHLGYRPPGYDRPIPISVSVGIAIYPDDGVHIGDVLAVADKRLLLAKTGGEDSEVANELRHSLTNNAEGFTMLDALVTAVDNKDRYTRRHSEDVLELALTIAESIGLDEHSKTVLAVAALLHDVGKIGVPDRILRKPGTLTKEEFQAVKQHPQMGAVIVGAVVGFEQTLDAIMYHHERWDGNGYPVGLAAEGIPLLARVMAVADGYSAMTTDRPYRQGMSSGEARAILAAGAGSQWDPIIVDALVSKYLSNAA